MRLRLTLDDGAGKTATGETSMDFADRDSLSIGRAEGCDWPLADASRLMSGKHCEIRRAGATYFLHDLSTNGTFLHGSKTRLEGPHPLRNGDRFVIGGYVIRVELLDHQQTTENDDQTRLVARPGTEPELRLTVDKIPDGVAECPPPARLGRHGALRIGRDEKTDWALPDPNGGISREHATIAFENGAFLLRDHSSNGTFVNNSHERITGSYRLRDGDRLLMGAYRITVHTDGVADGSGATVPASHSSDRFAVSMRPPSRVSAPMRRGGDPAAMLDDLPPAVADAIPGDAARTDGTEFVIINAGAYTHTSVAIRDALTGVALPLIEVHVSNVYRREPFRHHSYLSDIAVGVICGLGPHGYRAALDYALSRRNTRSA